MDDNEIPTEAKDQLKNTFDKVKEIVRKFEKRSIAGLMIGLQ